MEGFRASMLAASLLVVLTQIATPSERVTGDLFASSVAGIGDVDGDGRVDFATTTCAWRVDSEPGNGSGPCVEAISGKTGGVIWTGASGLHVQRFSTRSLCPVGDVDGDGRLDLAVVGGQMEHSPDSPRFHLEVALLSGLDGTTLKTLAVESGLDHPIRAEIACPGDVDGDSVSDLVVVAATAGTNPRSAVWFQSCATGEVLRWIERDPDWWMSAEWIDCPGDLDGDGVTDVALEAFDRKGKPDDPWQRKPRAVLVRSGRDGRPLLDIPVSKTWTRLHACGAGDVDRDGHVDVAIGAVDWIGNSGSFDVRIHSGTDGRLLRNIPSVLEAAKGGQLACAGDLDRDGYPDLLVGEYYHFIGGVVRVFSGRDGSSLRTWRDPLGGSDFSEYFGYSLTSPGDVDDDGFPDALIGQCTPWGDQPARLHVFSGKDGKPLFALDRSHLVRRTDRR